MAKKVLFFQFFVFLVFARLNTYAGTSGVMFPSNAVSLNGSQVDVLTAIRPGDVIRTKERGVAVLNFRHSKVLVPPDTIIRAEQWDIALDEGTAHITTSKTATFDDLPSKLTSGTQVTTLSVRARDLIVSSASAEITEFEVTRTNGLIVITASRNAVHVRCGSQTLLVEQGQKITRTDRDHCQR